MYAVGRLKALPVQRATPLPRGVARVGVGLAALLTAIEVNAGLRALHKPDLLRLPRIGALPDVPASGIGFFLGVWVVAAIAFSAGWHTRAAGAVLLPLQVYVLLLDEQLYSNHFYLLTLLTLLLTLAQSGAVLSLDARRRGPAPSIPAWPVALLRVQVSVVYGFAVAAKLNMYFLSGVVLRIQMKVPGIENLPPWVFMLLALASLATEAFLAVAFWNKRLRPLAFVVGLGFHLTILATMRILPDLLTFALLMGSAYLAFFSSIESGPAGELQSKAASQTAA
ncbi:MAG TPA: HTTM domain-containing protein [Actinomycetota bacterium]|nr:HTTM domain-containing protein [Actinomycetota bacterium]